MWKKIVTSVCILSLSGCQVGSKVAVKGNGGRTAYNMTLQQTTNEQMLLNLVRLRFLDFPFFLDINSITTQFTYSSKFAPSFPIPGFTTDNPAILGGELQWQNQPTISYTPLEGQSFASQLFRPIDLLTIQQLIYSGWDIDRVLRVTVQSINTVNNAPTAAGPAPVHEPDYVRFREMTKMLRSFQLQGRLQVGVEIKKMDDEMHGVGLQFSFPETEKGRELSRFFYRVRTAKDYYVTKIPLGFNEDVQVGIMPRSMMGCLYYLSLGVEVPNDKLNTCVHGDMNSEKVFDWKKLTGDLLNIKFSKRRPTDAFICTYYKGYYFYISDCDLTSKRTFVLLLQLYNLQSSGAKAAAPLLSLPLG